MEINSGNEDCIEEQQFSPDCLTSSKLQATEAEVPQILPILVKRKSREVSMCEGFGLGPEDVMSRAADHGDVLPSAGQWASPIIGTDEPDLHQHLSSSSSLGIFPIEPHLKDLI